MREKERATVLLIPYYNEQPRFDFELMKRFITEMNLDYIFVDDGSGDTSPQSVDKLVAYLEMQTSLKGCNLRVSKNVGKSNAVRIGLKHADSLGYQFALHSDFDLPYSTKDGRIALNTAKKFNVVLVSGARIRLAGGGNGRPPLRQWAGRVIATLIYLTLQKEMYDPQSPCKCYSLEKIADYLDPPFKSRWFGDIELLRRIGGRNSENQCFEFVMNGWEDKKDGALRIRSLFRVFLDFFKAYWG